MVWLCIRQPHTSVSMAEVGKGVLGLAYSVHHGTIIFFCKRWQLGHVPGDGALCFSSSRMGATACSTICRSISVFTKLQLGPEGREGEEERGHRLHQGQMLTLLLLTFLTPHPQISSRSPAQSYSLHKKQKIGSNCDIKKIPHSEPQKYKFQQSK